MVSERVYVHLIGQGGFLRLAQIGFVLQKKSSSEKSQAEVLGAIKLFNSPAQTTTKQTRTNGLQEARE